MKIIQMACVILVLAVSVSARQSSEDTSRGAVQSTALDSQTSPREQAVMHASLDMIHKEYADAVETYRGLLRDNPDDADLWNQLGIAYHQQTLLGEALKCYERAAKVDKKNAPAWNNIGTVYFQERRLSKAIRAYKKAIELDAQVGTFYGNLGIADLNSKHLPDALAAFRQALKLDPEVFAQNGKVGTILQDRSVDDHGTFFFLLAKSFAAAGNAERCSYYLRKSVDEGYANIGAAKTDPAFAGVLSDPGVRDVLGLPVLPPMPPRSQGI